MNKREKIKILKAMAQNLEDQMPPYGLCEAYHNVTDSGHCNDSKLIALGLTKPRKKHGNDWWYDWYDKESRKHAIDRAIKKLQS